MKIGVFFLGKTANSHYEAIIREYEKRLCRYVNLSIHTVEVKKKNLSISGRKEHETELLLQKIPGSSFLVCLDERGKQYSSPAFADLVSGWEMQAKKRVAFVVGGPDGHSERMRQRADLLFSLSKMTFTHDMIRIFLFEQLYRAYTIKNGEKYHK